MNTSHFSLMLTLLLMACGSERAANEGAETPAQEPAELGEATTEATPPTAEAEEAPDGPLAIGGTAPMADTQMRGVAGQMHSIASVAQEKGTLVVFTCNHCPYAIAWQDRLVAVAHDAMERGVGVIAINSNDPNEYPVDGFEGMVERAQELGIRFPYVVDETSDIARAFGAEKTPEAYLFNAEGALVYHGAIDDSQDPEQVQDHYLRDAITAVVDGGAVAQAETPAVGCSIKFRES